MRDALSHFNRCRIADKGHLALVATLLDEEGLFCGGLTGYISYQWLFVDLLWVSEHLRHQGQGRRLLLAGEGEARKRGCKHAWLDTFSFQAREFYEKLGYIVFGDLEDYPPGHHRYFLRKAL